MAKPAFIIGAPNPFNSPVTLYIRKRINDQFNGGKNQLNLQCTEGAAFFLLYNHGIVIDWPVNFGRHGGQWDDLFEHFKMYHVESEPTPGGTVHLSAGLSVNSTTNLIGHVAYVQRVKANGDIYVKEFNWPRNGMYNERWISKERWQNHYKARFVRYI